MLKTLIRPFRSSLLLNRIESFIVPQPGEGIAEITIREWLVTSGTRVKEFDKLCEAFSDKSSIDIKSPYDGVLKQILHQNEAVVPVGQPLFTIEIEDSKYPSSSKRAEPEIQPPEKKRTKKIAPSVKKLANQHKVDIDAVQFSEGVVTKEDVLKFISVNEVSKDLNEEFIRKTTVMDNPQHIDPPQSSTSIVEGSNQTVKLNDLQKKMLEFTKLSLIIPQLTYSEDVEIDNLTVLKTQLKSTTKGVKITYLPFFIKALSLALLDFPILNSVLLENLTEYLQKSSHNISFAMDTPFGLTFPNIKNVQTKSIYQIALDINRLQQLSSIGKLLDSDTQNSTITVSNLGSIGGSYCSHLVYPAQVLIGAFGSITPRLYKHENSYKTCEILSTSWSADHRLIDGATTARFVSRWKALIENPALMLLHLK